MKNFIKEFKTFIERGNVLDMAVGVVIGSAFGKIVTSLVENIIMPIIGLIIGGLDFSELTITVKDSVIAYGLFIQNCLDFLIIAFCIFTVIKIMNRLTRKHKKEQAASKSEQIVLLEEIRDLLKAKNKR